MNANERLQKVFENQKKAYGTDRQPTLQQRIEQLDKLDKLISENQDKICQAINQDFSNRCRQESLLLEITGLLSAIKYTKKRLKKWMKPQKRHIGISYFGAKNSVIPQPKGVVGIVTPWNYPLFLALSPAIGAMAAGNRCVIKMAANSTHLCQLMDTLVSKAFDAEWLCVIPEVSASLFSEMAWDHLVFTGSATTGKTVMASAAKNLTPVTLELGGKSPTIICDDFDIEEAAKRILLCKFLNAGQTCVAPDYLFVAEEKLEHFVEMAKTIVAKRYNGIESSDYTAIIDVDAYHRLQNTKADAIEKGAHFVSLVDGVLEDQALRKIAPQLAVSVSDDMRLMQEEVFGPILPIKTYRSLNEVTDYINQNERPLALYIFSNNSATQQQLIDSTISGGVCINDCMFHVGQHDLPFGGVGNSGMGHYHGKEGFDEFSKLRPIFKQAKKSAFLKLAPPYGVYFDKTIEFIIKFRL